MNPIKPHKFLQHELGRHMTAAGFSSKRTDFTASFNEETRLWASLQIVEGNFASLGVFPRVGFANLKVEKFFSHTLKVPRGPSLPTLSTTLGNLIPKSHTSEWYFEASTASLQQGAETVTQLVLEYGMPFMTQYPSLHSLIRWAEDPTSDRVGSHFQPNLLRAVIFYLAGKESNAAEVVSSQIYKARAAGEIDDPTYSPIVRLGTLLRSRGTLIAL